jgi:lipopolysaccharide heptosyltransferase II
MRILIINPFGIGDVLFTTPLLRAIKEADPESFVGYWCNERIKGILSNNPDIDEVFALSRGDIKRIFQNSITGGIMQSLKLFQGLRKAKFDLVLDFSLDHRYGLISAIAGIKRRIGFDYKNRGRFLTEKLKLEGYSSKHVVDYYSGLLKLLKIPAGNHNLRIEISKASADKIKRLLNYEGITDKDLLIGITPGAGGSWGKDAHLKQWAPLKFAQLADKLTHELKAQVLILGDAGDKAAADVLMNAAKIKPIDFTAKLTLQDFVAAIASVKLLITNDGGPLHIATALGVKTVSIFGPVDEFVYGPYKAEGRSAVVSAGSKCRPCYKNFRMPPCGKDRECLRNISVEEVFKTVKELLEK